MTRRHRYDDAPRQPVVGQMARRPGRLARSPAELYCSGVGVLFVGVGIAGFFVHGSHSREDVLGLLSSDLWHSLLHLGLGVAALGLSGRAPRAYASGLGAANTAIAAWGFVLGSGSAPILGFIAVNTADDFQRLAIGLLGLAAAAADRERGWRGAQT
jgi:hypothetical protein